MVQLSEMFWNHVMGGSVTMWDQEEAGGALAAKVHAVSITGKNGEPMLNFKGVSQSSVCPSVLYSEYCVSCVCTDVQILINSTN